MSRKKVEINPQNISIVSIEDIIAKFKQKARCFFSARKTFMLERELMRRLWECDYKALMLGKWHMDNGEGDGEFNEVCDRLIIKYTEADNYLHSLRK